MSTIRVESNDALHSMLPRSRIQTREMFTKGWSTLTSFRGPPGGASESDPSLKQQPKAES